MMSNKTLTVAKLIKQLREMPKEAEVILEGCDRYGKVGSVSLTKGSRGQELVTIKRTSDE